MGRARSWSALALGCALSLAAGARAAPDKPRDLSLEGAASSPALVLPSEQPGHWSVISGETVSTGHDLLSAEFGFPGVSFGYTHGLSDKADWGARFDLLYGVFDTTATQFGVQGRIPLRMVAARKEKLSVLLHLDPGLFLYAGGKSSTSLFGAGVTPGVALGFQVLPELRLALETDLPLSVQVLHGAQFVIGPQFGFGAEYFVDKNLSVGLTLRFGPVFTPTAGGDAQLGFVSQVSVGYRL